MKISIVTLSFNQHQFLGEAIDSIVQQGYPELDYIVVDPGSTDGSRELIRSYGNRIQTAILEPDRGASDGLNKGFAAATGDVFGFINADDLLLPGSLQRVADFFTSNPECDLAFGNGYIIDAEGRKHRHYRARSFTTERYFYGGTHFLQQSTFFRAETFRRSPGFNLETHTCWDGELFVTMVSQGARVGYIDADLACFRIYPASITGSGRLTGQYEKDCLRVFRQIQGRPWNAADSLRKVLYRSEGACIRLAGGLRGLFGRGAA